MAAPYTPIVLSTPVLNPSVGTSGAPPLAYLSNSQFLAEPTAISGADLAPAGNSGAQSAALALVLEEASSWANEIAYGVDAASDGASLAASLSVESMFTKVRQGELRLLCDYKPIIELVGCDVGANPSSVASIGTVSSLARFGRRTIYVPWSPSLTFRQGDTPAQPYAVVGTYGRVYVVWSYVAGYAHTKLVADATVGATTCSVAATDGNGGLWGVYPASGAFPGSQLHIVDGASSESVFVTSITPGSGASIGTTVLGTTPFAYAHTVPNAPDFLPVTMLPANVRRAVVQLAMALIKVRGSRAMVMPETVGGRPSRQALAQAGGLEDYEIAVKILGNYAVRLKKSGLD